MLDEVDAALAALYPDRRWAPPPSLPPDGELAADAAGLADELAGELRAATFTRIEGGCAYVYVLCQGRPPCAVPIRDGEAGIPEEWRDLPPGHVIEERYLRIALATRVPFAAVQEVAVEATLEPDGVTIREHPSAGVYSAPLLKRMQRLVAILPAYGRRHVDMGEIAGPPPGFDGAEWPALYAGTPAIVNYLFFAEPATMATTSWISREAV